MVHTYIDYTSVEEIPAVQTVPWFKQLYLAVEGTLISAWLFAFHSVPYNLIFSAFAVTPISGVFFTFFLLITEYQRKGKHVPAASMSQKEERVQSLTPYHGKSCSLNGTEWGPVLRKRVPSMSRESLYWVVYIIYFLAFDPDMPVFYIE